MGQGRKGRSGRVPGDSWLRQRRIVLRVGFLLLTFLLVFSVATALKVQRSVSNDTAEIYQRHMLQDERLHQLRRTLWLGANATRDFLLNPMPSRTQTFEEQLARFKKDQLSLLDELRQNAPNDPALASLREAINGYWAVLERTPEATENLTAHERYQYVQREVAPRRNFTSQILKEFATIHERALEEGQQSFAAARRSAAERLMIILALAVVCGIVVSVFSLYHSERLEGVATRHYLEMACAKRELEQLSARLMEVQEEERAKLARELHDEIGQTLATLRLEINRIDAAGIRPPELHERAVRARMIADRAVQSIRDLSLLLRPSLLDDLGLAPALQWQAEDFTRRTGVPAEFEEYGLNEELPDAVRTCVYRVLQESLHNCEKHAGATGVRITLDQAGGSLCMTVADDGCGFRVARRYPGRLGLIGMRERAQALDGSVTVESNLGRGTQVTLQLPVPVRPAAVA
jgi:signal transduction histidine kinase